MGTRKSDAFIAREREAVAISADLVGTGLRVLADSGGFTLIVRDLSRAQLDRVIDALRALSRADES